MTNEQISKALEHAVYLCTESMRGEDAVTEAATLAKVVNADSFHRAVNVIAEIIPGRNKPSTISPEAEALVALLTLIRELHNEVDCRIQHGADSNGHLEYIRNTLKTILTESKMTP